MGRAKNGSETLVNSLSQCVSLKDINFKALDVAWSAFDRFFAEIKERKVSGIIGFGEGKGPGIVIERIGKNIASGTDEFGVTKTNAKIHEGEPLSNSSRIRIPLEKNLKVVDSRDAGDFLCNYELFHINNLKMATSAFIHLPPQGDTPDDVYIDLLRPAVLEIVHHNFMLKQDV